jgi:hypothetical protein
MYSLGARSLRLGKNEEREKREMKDEEEKKKEVYKTRASMQRDDSSRTYNILCLYIQYTH